jgi:hypothetical protein
MTKPTLTQHEYMMLRLNLSLAGSAKVTAHRDSVQSEKLALRRLRKWMRIRQVA